MNAMLAGHVALLSLLLLMSLLQTSASGLPSVGAESTIIAAAIVTVISALVGGTVSVVNSISAAADRKASRQERAALSTITTSTNQKADTIIEKAVEIHTLTNSNLSKVTAALEVANQKIQGLEQLMATLARAAMESKAAADVAKVEVLKARAEQPPVTTAREPLKVEVINDPLVVHDALAEKIHNGD